MNNCDFNGQITDPRLTALNLTHGTTLQDWIMKVKHLCCFSNPSPGQRRCWQHRQRPRRSASSVRQKLPPLKRWVRQRPRRWGWRLKPTSSTVTLPRQLWSWRLCPRSVIYIYTLLVLKQFVISVVCFLVWLPNVCSFRGPVSKSCHCFL